MSQQKIYLHFHRRGVSESRGTKRRVGRTFIVVQSHEWEIVDSRQSGSYSGSSLPEGNYRLAANALSEVRVLVDILHILPPAFLAELTRREGTTPETPRSPDGISAPVTYCSTTLYDKCDVEIGQERFEITLSPERLFDLMENLHNSWVPTGEQQRRPVMPVGPVSINNLLGFEFRRPTRSLR